MALPVKILPKSTVDLDGDIVEIRSLSRAEAVKIPELANDNDKLDNYILACGTDSTEEQAADWRNKTDPTTVGKVVDAIIELSAFTTKTSDPKKNSNGH